MAFEHDKYVTTPTDLKKTIDLYGVAIIPNVLKKEEIGSMRNGMWDYLEHTTQKFETPIDRENDQTWIEYLKLYPKHSMLLQQYGVGHSQFVWDIRQNPKVVDVFSHLWKVPPEDLLTSFDGASFHFPPENTNRGWYRQTWYHTDQSYFRPDFECIQSWVTAYDVEEGDATLAFLEKSNTFHKEFQEHHQLSDKSDWYKHNRLEQSFYEDKGCEEKRIKCKAGSMVFWDSRTIHCGTEPIRARKEKNLRNVVYVCMKPRSQATEANLRKKRKAFNDLRMTTHWPHKPILFPKNPRTYGGPLPNITEGEAPKMTELGLKIAGF
jgi:hypothetical protein